MSQLEAIDISDNMIDTISNFSFTSLPNLKVLNMQHNIIKYVGSEAFTYLPSLQVLKVNINQLYNQVFVHSAEDA